MKISPRLCLVDDGGGADTGVVVVIVVRQCYIYKVKTKHIHTQHNRVLLKQKIIKVPMLK